MYRLRALFCIVVIAACGIGLPAIAADHVIEQKDLSFSKPEITIAAGDKIKFTNNDRTSHHVWTKDNGVNISSSMLRAGESYDIRFEKPGTYTIRCHIHPKMKMTVIVR